MLLVIYSFNASKLVTVWAAFPAVVRRCLAQPTLLDSAWVTLRVALSSTLALVLGTMAGVVLTRIARFPAAPVRRHDLGTLVMPEVILGLSLLLLFVSLGIVRGFWTIVIAHTTFAMCYVTVVVHPAGHLRPQPRGGGDGSGRPAQDLLRHLPIIAPALIGGWLLASPSPSTIS